MNQYEASHYKHDIDIENDNESRSIMYSLIPHNSTVLDVGCACGDLGVILKQNKKCNVYGLEYSIESIEIAKKTNAYNNIKQCNLDFLDTNDYKEYLNLFDCIVLGDIIEHLKNPMETIEKLKKFLKNDGYFIISTPNISHASIKISLLLNKFDYTDYGILDKTHLRFFTLDSLLSMFKSLNFDIKNFNYTVASINGSQGKINYQNIPISALKYILKNEESHCFQYIFKLEQNKTFTSIDNYQLIKNANNYNLLKKVKRKSLIYQSNLFVLLIKKLKRG